MRVIVYVEGTSDKLALESLLSPLLERRRNEGVGIQFFEAPAGDKKASVLCKVPKRAANIVVNDPAAVVVALPDLYPRNVGFPHSTVDELVKGIHGNFERAMEAKKITDIDVYRCRFKVFCFKHDLEALLLAAESQLAVYLNVGRIKQTWTVPVEDQNHDHPPKKVIEALFRQHKACYHSVTDARLILGAADYKDVAMRCSQCFAPFVEFLSTVAD